MPKIVIKETDNTGSVQQSSISNTVYVPIRADSVIDTAETSARRNTNLYACNSISALNKYFPEGTYKSQLDWRICKHLINIGFDLIVQGWIPQTKNTQTSGQYYRNLVEGTEAAKPCKTGWVTTAEKPVDGWPDNPGTISAITSSADWALVGQTAPAIIVESKDGQDIDVYYQYGIAYGEGDDVPESFYVKAIEGMTLEGEAEVTESYTQYGLNEDFPADNSSKTSYAFVQIVDETIIPGNPPVPTVKSGVTPTYTYYYANNTVPSDDATEALVYRVSAEGDYEYTTEIAPTTIAYSLENGVSDLGWKTIEDKGLYDVRFLTHGTFAYTDAMGACANNRGDCIALRNAQEDVVGFDYTATEVRKQFDSTNGTYCAGFTPWFYSKSSDLVYVTPETTEEEEDDKGELIPAAYGYLFAYANAVKNNPEWYAVAGFERGVIPELTDVAYTYTTADVEILQARGAEEEVPLDADADNVGFAINPIAYVRPAGYIIWGNRTLIYNGAAKKTIATSFLNVRNGVSAIKKVLYAAARKYTFEQNNEILWVNFQAYTRPLLDNMQSGNGLLGYRWVRVPTTAKARLSAKLKIVPIEAVEDFELEVVLTDDLEVSE